MDWPFQFQKILVFFWRGDPPFFLTEARFFRRGNPFSRWPEDAFFDFDEQKEVDSTVCRPLSGLMM